MPEPRNTGNLVLMTYKIDLIKGLLDFNFPNHRKKGKRKKKKIKLNKRRREIVLKRKIRKLLRVATKIAKYTVEVNNHSYSKPKITSTKQTKHLGHIPACINNQIIRKYGKNKKCKDVHRVNLIVPCQKGANIVYDESKHLIHIKPLKLTLRWTSPVAFQRINQVEINEKYVYVCVDRPKTPQIDTKDKWIGVDLNVKGYMAVAGDYETKDALELGYEMFGLRHKYRLMRSRHQRLGRHHTIKQMGNKEHRIMNNYNQDWSTQIIRFALAHDKGIAVENLSGIRNARTSKRFKGFLNSWSFYRLQLDLEYKCDFYGIPFTKVPPEYTSQICSKCEEVTKCKGKKYQCKHCGLQIDRDINASYNIGKRAEGKI